MNEHYKCDRCDFVQYINWGRPRVYETGGRAKFCPLIRYGWCRVCSKVVVVEFVPTMKALRRELLLIKTKAPDTERQFTTGYQDPEIETIEVNSYIFWRKKRVAPSRCFECGGHDLVISGRPFGDLPCQRCPGTLHLNFMIFGGSEVRVEPDVYSLEGVLLRRGEG